MPGGRGPQKIIIPAEVTHRIGNWCEEAVLREQCLKDFAQKIQTGSLSTQKVQMKLITALQPVTLSNELRFGQNIMIKSVATSGHMVVDVPNNYPERILETDIFQLNTTENECPPTARSSFTLEPADSYSSWGSVDDRPRYGQKFHIVVSDLLVEKPMYLCSETKTFVSYSRRSKEQQAFLSFHKDNRAVWQILFTDPHLQLEMEGEVVPVNTPVIIQHSLTGNYLGSEASLRSMIRNDFGVEWEVDCFTRKLEPLCNRWVFEVNEAVQQSGDGQTREGADRETAKAE
ncbi:hypothetical protein HDU76_003348 [Blyttiomyces sp. JEL0837]|nr:hypothetical protein HDU76_003348 [Blyttiomyces sp. JEL0837]